jgi:hypothetical protein
MGIGMRLAHPKIEQNVGGKGNDVPRRIVEIKKKN